MKNKALISFSLLILFGVSACSTSTQKPKHVAKKSTNNVTNNNSSASIRPSSNQNTTYKNQLQAADQKEQERLAYNYTWQQQQLIQKNSPPSISEAQARHSWQQKQALLIKQERSRLTQQSNEHRNRQHLEQQRKNQQYTQEQSRLARLYAAQQMQKQSQYVSNRSVRPQRMQAPRQVRQQQQPKMQAPRQLSQHSQYLALLQQTQPQQNQNRNTPRGTPQGGIANLAPAEIRTIGDKIFRNESGGDVDKLVHWNVGENFASMGIGHFTWYPAGRRNRYGNTFPGLLDHLRNKGVRLPAWVQQARHSGAPWRTKNELKYAKNSPRVKALQNLLYETRYLQAEYIFERAKRAMPRLIKATPPHLRAHVGQNLNAIANTPGGWYALIDYVNFKGEGLSRKGGYKGQNWGLLQVLENMRPSQPGQMALNNFADSAIQILERRVRNSNPSRGESRWMRGWTIRCNTYRQPFHT